MGRRKKVACEVTATADGVCLSCGRCGHKVEVRGTSESAVGRGLALLVEECPQGERNQYRDGDEGRD